jgi:hypothetical protein
MQIPGFISSAAIGVALIIQSSVAPQQTEAGQVKDNRLSFLGISIGEEVSSAVRTMDSVGFIKSACIVRNPYSQWDSLCFQRGTDELFSLGFKNGTLGSAFYQFSGFKYDATWNELFKKYGKPRAYLGNRGGWLADVWQDESMKDEIRIMKIVDGTGTVTLGSADTTLKFMVVKFSSSPNEYSSPISGRLHLAQAQNESRNKVQSPATEATANAPQRGNGQEISCPGCMTIRVLHSTLVNITATDDNGYAQTRSPQLQRLTVILDKSGDTPKDTALFSYHPPWAPLLTKGSTLDILCLGTNRNGTFSPTCPALAVGSVHDTPLMGAENPVYLQQQFTDGSYVGWQVLEICHGSQCAQVSTIHDRPTGTWR